MNNPLKYPKLEAIDSVLKKLGIDPNSRYDKYDQDHEYTTCNTKELADYYKLYQQDSTTDLEKRVLGCYFFECLNDYFELNEKHHPLQSQLLSLIHQDIHIHETEVRKWSDSSDPDPENWWPITSGILEWQRAQNENT